MSAIDSFLEEYDVSMESYMRNICDWIVSTVSAILEKDTGKTIVENFKQKALHDQRKCVVLGRCYFSMSSDGTVKSVESSVQDEEEVIEIPIKILGYFTSRTIVAFTLSSVKGKEMYVEFWRRAASHAAKEFDFVEVVLSLEENKRAQKLTY